MQPNTGNSFIVKSNPKSSMKIWIKQPLTFLKLQQYKKARNDKFNGQGGGKLSAVEHLNSSLS